MHDKYYVSISYRLESYDEVLSFFFAKDRHTQKGQKQDAPELY